MKTLVVNLFGVPGSGKSTGAAYVFSQLKMCGVNAELVTEFPKAKVWENSKEAFKNQVYLFGEQSYRQSCLDGKVDVIVTDSPLPLSILYNDDPRLTENFNLTVMDVYNSYANLNFLLRRTKPYNHVGRLQTEEESNALAKPIEDLLQNREIPYSCVEGEINGYNTIVNRILDFIKDVQNKENANTEKSITAAQFCLLKAAMCENFSACGDCPIGKTRDEQDVDLSCDKFSMKKPEMTIRFVQEWAVRNGFLTEDLVETNNYRNLVMKAQNEGIKW